MNIKCEFCGNKTGVQSTTCLARSRANTGSKPFVCKGTWTVQPIATIKPHNVTVPGGLRPIVY